MNYIERISDALEPYIKLYNFLIALGLGGGAMLLPIKQFISDYWIWFLSITIFSLSFFLLSIKDKCKERKNIISLIDILPRHDAASVLNFSGIEHINLYLKIINMSSFNIQIHSASLRFGNNIKTITSYNGDLKVKTKSINQIHFDGEITSNQKILLSKEVTINGDIKFLFEGDILEKPFTFDKIYVHGS